MWVVILLVLILLVLILFLVICTLYLNQIDEKITSIHGNIYDLTHSVIN